MSDKEKDSGFFLEKANESNPHIKESMLTSPSSEERDTLLRNIREKVGSLEEIDLQNLYYVLNYLKIMDK